MPHPLTATPFAFWSMICVLGRIKKEFPETLEIATHCSDEKCSDIVSQGYGYVPYAYTTKHSPVLLQKACHRRNPEDIHKGHTALYLWGWRSEVEHADKG